MDGIKPIAGLLIFFLLNEVVCNASSISQFFKLYSRIISIPGFNDELELANLRIFFFVKPIFVCSGQTCGNCKALILAKLEILILKLILKLLFQNVVVTSFNQNLTKHGRIDDKDKDHENVDQALLERLLVSPAIG